MDNQPSAALAALERTIASRRDAGSDRPSYVVALLRGGRPAIHAKLREELEERLAATPAGGGPIDRPHAIHEAADLVFTGSSCWPANRSPGPRSRRSYTAARAGVAWGKRRSGARTARELLWLSGIDRNGPGPAPSSPRPAPRRPS